MTDGPSRPSVLPLDMGRAYDMRRWIVIIARDRPDLWVTWAAFYGGAAQVEVLFDRRQGQPGTGTGDRPDRRARVPRDDALQERGFVVIRQCNTIGRSC